MKVWTLRIFLTGGVVIDRLSTTNNRDEHLKEYLDRGLRTSDGDCLIVYPARMIERIEVYEQGRAPSLDKKPASSRAKRSARRSAGKTDGGIEEL